MSRTEIVRAWRDYDYWFSLSESERARIPENPAGVVELMDAELDLVAGGSASEPGATCGSCRSQWSQVPCCY
jgi:mersacidin/lichenicidin family type 2 lantibiotic